MFLHNRTRINLTSFIRVRTFRLYNIWFFWLWKLKKKPPSQFSFIFRARKQWNKFEKWNKIEWNKIELGQYKFWAVFEKSLGKKFGVRKILLVEKICDSKNFRDKKVQCFKNFWEFLIMGFLILGLSSYVLLIVGFCNLSPRFPLSPVWRISGFKKRLHETERL